MRRFELFSVPTIEKVDVTVPAPPLEYTQPMLPFEQTVAPRVTSNPVSKRTEGKKKEFQNELSLASLFMRAVAERRIRTIRTARAAFRPFRSTLYSYQIKSDGAAKLSFHTVFRQAEDEVLLQACHLMLARTRNARKKVIREAYDRFVEYIPSCAFELPGARTVRKTALAVPGKHRSLEESFERINERYFGGKLGMPELCWSPRRARRILGSYEEDGDRVIVSRIFDSPRIPLFVLDYLMYHELLHKFLGIGKRADGRRCMHGPKFKRLERKFEQYKRAVAFLETI